MAIRWTGKLTDELIETVDKYNKKIKRLTDKGNYIVPSYVNWRDIAESVKTRSDLKRKLGYIKDFTKKGAEKVVTLNSGVKVTKYQLDVAKKMQSLAKRRVKARMKYYESLEATEYGERQNLYYYKMGDEYYENLKSRLEKLERPIESMTNFNKYYDYLTSASLVNYSYRDKVYMNAYFDEMIFNLGFAVGYDKSKINEIKKKIYDNLTDAQITRMMQSEASITSLKDWYNNIHRRYGMNKTNIGLIREEFNELYENIDEIIKTYAV